MFLITDLIAVNNSVVIVSNDNGSGHHTSKTLIKMLHLLGYTLSVELANAIDALSIADAKIAVTNITSTVKKILGANVEHKTLSLHASRDLYDFVYGDWAINRLNLAWEIYCDIAAGKFAEDTSDASLATIPTHILQKMSPRNAQAWCITALKQPQTCAPSERATITALTQALAAAGYPITAEHIGDSVIWRENIPLVLHATNFDAALIERLCTTSGDALRLATYLSDASADLSLARPPRFKLSSAHRRLILSIVDRVGNGEDMMRQREIWLRLGEYLHPMAKDHARRWPHAAKLWDALRNDPKNIERWNVALERALQTQEISYIRTIASRPGAFARALIALMSRNEHISGGKFRGCALYAFISVMNGVPTATLLSLYKRLINLRDASRHDHVVFYPKGADSTPIIAKDNRATPNEDDINTLIESIHAHLVSRFAQRPSLGNVWIDPDLAHITVNRTKRSAMTGTNTPMNRGSVHALTSNPSAIRLFVHWANNNTRVDVDLSASILDADFNTIESVSYMQLNGTNMAHSGDITDGLDGASEYIDINLSKNTRSVNGRYLAVFINSFSGQSFAEFPCFAGVSEHAAWPIPREFDAKGVALKFDINTQGRRCIPLIYDLVAQRIVVINANAHGRAGHNMHNSENLIADIVRDAVEAPQHKLNCYDIACLHAEARGTRVNRREDATTIFAVDTTTPDAFTALASDLPEDTVD